MYLRHDSVIIFITWSDKSFKNSQLFHLFFSAWNSVIARPLQASPSSAGSRSKDGQTTVPRTCRYGGAATSPTEVFTFRYLVESWIQMAAFYWMHISGDRPTLSTTVHKLGAHFLDGKLISISQGRQTILYQVCLKKSKFSDFIFLKSVY